MNRAISLLVAIFFLLDSTIVHAQDGIVGTSTSSVDLADPVAVGSVLVRCAGELGKCRNSNGANEKKVVSLEGDVTKLKAANDNLEKKLVEAEEKGKSSVREVESRESWSTFELVLITIGSSALVGGICLGIGYAAGRSDVQR